MTIATHKTAVELAQALGLDTRHLRSFSVHCAMDTLIEIRAQYLAEVPADDALTNMFERRFELHEIDPA